MNVLGEFYGVLAMRLAWVISMVFAGAVSAAELELTIVDLATGEPIGQTRVRGAVDGSQSSLVTGANGVGVFPLPASGVEYDVMLTALAEGYVPTLVHWEVSKVELPELYTLRLERGTTVSGLVAYEDGEPIAGASVRLFVSGTREGIVQPAITDLEIITDDEGRWRCEQMPKSLTKLQVRVSPPGGTRVRSVTFSEGGDNAIAALRDGTARIEISRRFRLAGKILDDAGEPVSGAQLVGWPVAGTSSTGSFVESDRDGSFVFQNVKAERMMISTVKEGMAPDMTAATPGPDAEAIEILLAPGKTIRGRVTSNDGEPIEGVRVAPHSWRGQRVLTIELKTDADGRFVWNGAPDEGVVFEIRKPGYAGLLEMMLHPDDEDYAISLDELLRIGGSVVDDETGDHLEAFKVFQGVYWESVDDVQWSGYASDEGYKGEYELYIEAGTPAVKVRVEADGYLPVLSRVYHAEEGYQRYDVRMKKGSGPSGVVRKPDGSIANDVTVFMSALPGSTVLNNGNTSDETTRYVMTDDEGQFSFAPLHPEFRLAVIDEAGFAVGEFELGEEAYDIDLAASASIEGTVSMGGKPAAYERVRLTFDPQYNDGLRLSYSANTDPDGRFAVAGLPAGEARVELLKQVRNQFVNSHGVLVGTKSGETTQANIGGDGRTVVGKISLPEDSPGDVDFLLQSYVVQAKVVPPSVPSSVDQNNSDEVQAWYSEWEVSDEGRAYRSSQQMFPAEMEPNGMFRITDVPEGEYHFGWNFLTSAGERVGKIAHTFSVPAGDGDFELGALMAETPKTMKVGEDAPLFEAASLDGAPVKLEDFRGKYVLLDFWATWCGPCIGETPNLVDVFKRFGEDDRFAMIGLSLDNAVDEPRDYTTKNEMNWTQVFLGEWSTTPVPDEYGVEGIPTIMLLGPDGKIVATNLRGPGIADAVAKFLE
jgi:peroxiredoxin